MSPPEQKHPKLITLAGECRNLLTRCQSGHRVDSCVAFAELNHKLLLATVLNPVGRFPTLDQAPENKFAQGRPGQVIALRNGWFLRFLLTFRVEPSESAGGAMKLKTLSSAIQYQQDAANEDSWVFRYDYMRVPRDRYVPGHVHVRAAPTQAACLDRRARGFEDIHFPTGRVTLEAIIRLLVDDFNTGANEPDEVWRPLLHETERLFIPIARQPQARPER